MMQPRASSYFFFFGKAILFPQHAILSLKRLYCIHPCQYKRIHPFSSCFHQHWEFFSNWRFVGLIISSSYFLIFALFWLEIRLTHFQYVTSSTICISSFVNRRFMFLACFSTRMFFLLLINLRGFFKSKILFVCFCLILFTVVFARFLFYIFI